MSLETLQQLVLLHAQAIAFENLNPLLRLPVRLDEESLARKLVEQHRGGYCFEQNGLLQAVLEHLGFQVTGLAARVLWNQPSDAITMRGHKLLLITIEDGRYLADVGFGGCTLTGVLTLESGIEQQTPHEPFRLIDEGPTYLMQALIGEQGMGQWQTLYRFDLTPQFSIDYEVTNWYLSTHPASNFLHNLIAARPFEGGRYALRNRELAVHRLHGTTQRRTLKSVEELRATLSGPFGIALPEGEALEQALQKIITT